MNIYLTILFLFSFSCNCFSLSTPSYAVFQSIYTDMYPVDKTFQEIFSEFRKRCLRINYLNQKVFTSLKNLSTHPEKWPKQFQCDWEFDFLHYISFLSSSELADLFLTFSPHDKYYPKYDLKNVKDVTEGTAELSDLYGNAYSVLNTCKALGDPPDEHCLKMVWIIREWIYRHWDRKQKIISFYLFPKDVQDRIIPSKTNELTNKGL